jgi:CHASE2 domain-containing sensor protein
MIKDERGAYNYHYGWWIPVVIILLILILLVVAGVIKVN